MATNMEIQFYPDLKVYLTDCSASGNFNEPNPITFIYRRD